MKGFKQHILEKLKVSSHNYMPSIDSFVKEFEKYMDRSERAFSFRYLESCKDYHAADPKTFIDVLPSYEFTRNEEFLNLHKYRKERYHPLGWCMNFLCIVLK